jgi:methionyl aminopeptidase
MTVQTQHELEALRRVGRVVRMALDEMRLQVRPGITTGELDEIGERVFREYGAQSAPRLVYGFPGVNCISLNDEAVHGVPGDRRLEAGDLVKLDVTAELDGFMADAAVTVVLEPATRTARNLAQAAEAAFWKALPNARTGRPINEIGRAIEGEVRKRGFKVLPELHSHGVGRSIHEEPSVPQYYDRGLRDPLTDGLVITIEPIISAGSDRTAHAPDGWAICTTDGSLSAHYEHTVVVTRSRPIVLTAA